MPQLTRRELVALTAGAAAGCTQKQIVPAGDSNIQNMQIEIEDTKQKVAQKNKQKEDRVEILREPIGSFVSGIKASYTQTPNATVSVKLEDGREKIWRNGDGWITWEPAARVVDYDIDAVAIDGHMQTEMHFVALQIYPSDD